MKFRVLVDAMQQFFDEFEDALEYVVNAEGETSLQEWDWRRQEWIEEPLPCIAA